MIRFGEAVSLTDAAFAGVQGIESLQLAGAGVASLTLESLAAAFAGEIRISAAPSLSALIIEGGTLGRVTPLRITATAGADRLIGGAGDDIFTGGGGADLIQGGGGDDRILLGDAAALRAATLQGGTGQDRLEFAASVTLADADFAGVAQMEGLILRGVGLSSLVLREAASLAFAEGLRVTVAAGAVLSLDAAGLDPALRLVALGAAGADSLVGGQGDDSLSGGGGEDLLAGGLGSDTLMAGDGDDALRLTLGPPGSASDLLRGGAGVDVLVLDLALEDYTRADVKAELVRLATVLGRVVPGAEAPRFVSAPLQLDMAGVETVLIGRDGGLLLSLAQATMPFAPLSDSYQTSETIPLSVNAAAGVLANDLGLALSVQAGVLTTLRGGSVTLRADGSFDYRPAANVSGLDRFTYAVTDLRGDTGVATATITVTPNSAPVFTGPTSLTLAEGGGFLSRLVGLVTVNDPDPDGLRGIGSFVTMLGGGSVFTWNPGNGEITTRLLDFETGPSWTLAFRASDGRRMSEHVLTVTVTDVNEAPVVNGPGTIQIAEGSQSVAVLAAINASDPDAGAVLTYSLVNGPAGFRVDASTGIISFFGELDFETTPSFSLEVQVSDGSLATTRDVTVQVRNVDEPPALVPGSPKAFTLAENSAGGTVVGRLQAADPDAGQSVTFSITTPGAPFAINAASGEIRVTGALDYETTPFILLPVSLVAGGRVVVEQIRFDLTDVNEAPVLTGPTALQIAEGRYTGQVIGRIQASDADAGAVLQYDLVTSPPGFSVKPATGDISFYGAFDFEAPPSITLLLRVSDGSLITAGTLAIEVVDVNEPPALVVGSPTTFSVAEGTASGAVVGRVQAVDPDAGQRVIFSLLTSNDRFVIDMVTGDIRVTGLLDYETTTFYDLDIALLSNGQSTVAGIRVNVADVNEAPIIAAGQGFSIAEGNYGTTPLGRVTATDPDGETALAFSLVNPPSAFSIDAATGVLLLNGRLDFEAGSLITLKVRVSDGSLATTRDVLVAVIDRPEPPVFLPASPIDVSLGEHAAIGTQVAQVLAADQDAGSALRFNYLGSNLPFAIDPVTGVVRVAGLLDREQVGSYVIPVTVSSGGETATTSLLVTLTDEPEPLGGPRSVTINENVLLPGVVAYFRTNGNALDPVAARFSLTGADGYLSIDPITGAVSQTAPLNFETTRVLDMRVVASDGVTSLSQPFGVQVADVPEPNIITGLPGVVTVSENTPAGLGPVDSGLFTFRLVDPEGQVQRSPYVDSVVPRPTLDLFFLNFKDELLQTGADGRLYWATDVTIFLARPLDHETAPSYALKLGRLTGNTDDSIYEVVIQVQDVNEAPRLLPSGAGYGSVTEGYHALGLFEFLTATDPDANATLTYSLADGFGLFTINPETGQIALSGTLDFEAQSVYDLNVRVSDGSLTAERMFPFYVADVNEAPGFIAPAAVNVAEDTPSGTVIANVRTTDPDGPAATEITASSMSGGFGRFTWNQVTGDVTLTGRLDFETTSRHVLSFSATDGVLNGMATLIVNVADVLEGPILPPLDPFFG